MNAWQKAGQLAAYYLGTSLPAEEIKCGDIVTGFHLEPIAVIESAPVPHPTHSGWWTYERADRYGVGTYVLMWGETVSVGRIPLSTNDPGPYRRLLGAWAAPCGCLVNRGEHCEECGPYNGNSPLCVNRRNQ